MHVGKPMLQQTLDRQMHGRHGFEMPQLTWMDVMVIVNR